MESVNHSEDRSVSLYICKYSTKAAAITLNILDFDLYSHLRDRLQSIYDFTVNKNENGIVTCTRDQGLNCVITLYYNQTLFIQGKGCKTWKSNVLDKMMETYESLETVANSTSISSPSSSTTPTTSPTSSSTPKQSNRSGTLAYIGKLVNSLRSPSKRTPIKQSDSVIISVSPDSEDTVNNLELSHQSQPCSVDVHVQTPSSTAIEVESPTLNSTSEQQKVKSKNKKRKTGNHAQMMSETSNSHNVDHLSTSQTHVKQVIDNDNSLSVQELEKSVKLLREKYNLQSEKTEKLGCEAIKMKATLKAQYEKNDKLSIDASNLKKELTTSTTKLLVIEEENVKLKNTISQIAREKSELVTQLIKSQMNSETCDAKIQSVVDNLEIKLAAEMTNLKTTLLREISDLKSQNQSVLATVSQKQPTPVPVRESNQQNTSPNKPSEPNVLTSQPDVRKAQPDAHKALPSVSKSSERDNSCILIEDNNSSKVNIFIAGDSITRRISPSKMSNESVNVKIKSHPGGKVGTITKSISEMSRAENDYMKELHAVVLHVGTNNISDGESPESVCEKLENTVSLIKRVSPKAKVIVSSVLPWKAEKVVNNVISSANRMISEMCEKAECHFLDNDKVMKENGRINFSLYQDKVHLNQSGGKVFGSHISSCIDSVLGLSIPSLVPNDHQQPRQHNQPQPEGYNSHQSSLHKFQYGRNSDHQQPRQHNQPQPEGYNSHQSSQHNFQYGRNSGRRLNYYSSHSNNNNQNRRQLTNKHFRMDNWNQYPGMEMVYMPVPAHALNSYM